MRTYDRAGYVSQPVVTKVVNEKVVMIPSIQARPMLVHDLNADGLPDLTLGDVDFSTLLHLSMAERQRMPVMVSQTTNFPNIDSSGDLDTFPNL